MILTDSHTHMYLEAFDDDRHESIRRAIGLGVKYMLLPNIDRDSIPAMMALVRDFPGNCLPMIGLHPTSVGADYREHLDAVEEWIVKDKFYAVGEIGIDLYWDKTYFTEQQDAFRFQVDLAGKYGLPVVIHSRNSFDELFKLLEEINDPGLRGVFHCFTGNLEQAQHITGMGFYLGIGGVLTYKNSGLKQVMEQVALEHIVLETDSPFLAPVPFRGKRNESAYLPEVAKKLAEIKGLEPEEIANITTENARRLFNFK